MDINWNSIIEGIASGVSGSIIISASIFLFFTIRNIHLRKSIIKSLRNLGIGGSINGITLTAYNKTERPIIIRRISISIEATSYRLNPTGKTESASEGRKLTKDELRRIKAGETIQVGTEVSMSWPTPVPTSGFTEIAPFTGHTFVLPAQIAATIKSEATRVNFLVEYLSWDNSVKIIEFSEEKSISTLNSSIGSLLEELKSGSFNEARRKFNLPPIDISH